MFPLIHVHSHVVYLPADDHYFSTRLYEVTDLKTPEMKQYLQAIDYIKNCSKTSQGRRYLQSLCKMNTTNLNAHDST